MFKPIKITLSFILLVVVIWVADSYFRIGDLAVAGAAKSVCSGLYVSKRSLDNILVESVLKKRVAFLQKRMEVDLDKDRRSVTVSLPLGVKRTARQFASQGCIILPDDSDEVYFEPVELDMPGIDSDDIPWPQGDRVDNADLPETIDMSRIEKAVESVFAAKEALTHSMVVVYGDHLLAERYANGGGVDVPMESWSMGKSIIGTLFGVLENQGEIGLDDKAPISEWQTQGDERQTITMANLLNMSSGLECSFRASFFPRFEQGCHGVIYRKSMDVFAFARSREPEFEPNTVGRYRNVDPLLVNFVTQQLVESRGESFLSFPQRALFDKLGIRNMVLETDAYGNYIATGFDLGTARDWARLGMLYLQKGVWQGERLLSESFVEFVQTPAPAYPSNAYGGLFWLNKTGFYNVPEDAYVMSGLGDQITIVVPSHNLVIVRMGHINGGGEMTDEIMNHALGEIVAAVSVAARRGE